MGHINVIVNGDQKAALVAKYAVELGVVFVFVFSKNGMPQFQLLKSDYSRFQNAMNRADLELHRNRFKKGDKVVVRGFDMPLVFDHYSEDGKLARVFIEGESWDTKHSVLFARPWALAPNDERTMKEEGWIPDLTSYKPKLTKEFLEDADIEANTPITAGCG